MKVEEGNLFIEPGAKLAPITKISVKGWILARQAIKMNGYITEERIPCNSPSMAAAIVCGHNRNGWEVWKNNKGEAIDVYRKIVENNDLE